jgi:hypothetical protein
MVAGAIAALYAWFVRYLPIAGVSKALKPRLLSVPGPFLADHLLQMFMNRCHAIVVISTGR